MDIYDILIRKTGLGAANAIVIVARAVAIATIVLLSDKGFTTFTYLQLGR